MGGRRVDASPWCPPGGTLTRNLDVVYLVRPGDSNEELRHSLRSLKNMPHRDVWFVGHLPRWVQGVEHVPGNRAPSGHQCVWDNVRLACSTKDLSDPFVMMNDDFFVTRPVDRLGVWWRQPLSEHVASLRGWSAWRQSLVATMDWLTRQGFHHPRSFELHVPLLVRRQEMADALARAAGFSPLFPPQWRTLYGNTADIDAVQACDVKITRTDQTWDRSAPFLSTDDQSFASLHVGDCVRAMFPDPSPYERE